MFGVSVCLYRPPSVLYSLFLFVFVSFFFFFSSRRRHTRSDRDWSSDVCSSDLDVLSEAKEKGIVRAHGCSCHSIEALRAAAKSPWVDVDLVRINPVGAYMDADPDTVLAVLLEMRAAGKGIVGMKILGQGELRPSPRRGPALRPFA